MIYPRTREAVFLDRPNRFVAEVELEGKRETVHVKNTGRCRELLLPGARVILAPGEMVNLSIPAEKLQGLDKADSILVRIEVPEA